MSGRGGEGEVASVSLYMTVTDICDPLQRNQECLAERDRGKSHSKCSRGDVMLPGRFYDACVFDYYSYPRLLSCTYIMLYLFINVTKSDF